MLNRIYLLYVCSREHVPQHTYEGHKATCGSWFSPAFWVTESELGLSVSLYLLGHLDDPVRFFQVAEYLFNPCFLLVAHPWVPWSTSPVHSSGKTHSGHHHILTSDHDPQRWPNMSPVLHTGQAWHCYSMGSAYILFTWIIPWLCSLMAAPSYPHRVPYTAQAWRKGGELLCTYYIPGNYVLYMEFRIGPRHRQWKWRIAPR